MLPKSRADMRGVPFASNNEDTTVQNTYLSSAINQTMAMVILVTPMVTPMRAEDACYIVRDQALETSFWPASLTASPSFNQPDVSCPMLQMNGRHDFPNRLIYSQYPFAPNHAR